MEKKEKNKVTVNKRETKALERAFLCVTLEYKIESRTDRWANTQVLPAPADFAAESDTEGF